MEMFMKSQKKYIAQFTTNAETSVDRNKKEFKSLKRTLIQYDTKEGFMDAIMMGRPYPQEDSYLEQSQKELNVINDELKVIKYENREYKEGLSFLIEAIFDCLEEFDKDQVKIHRNLIDL